MWDPKPDAPQAIRGEFGETTYGALARHVNRCGNALAALGIDASDRMLMVVKDCPEFFYLFWGATMPGLEKHRMGNRIMVPMKRRNYLQNMKRKWISPWFLFSKWFTWKTRISTCQLMRQLRT